MPASRPNTSPQMEAILAKGLLEKLPITFGVYCFDRIRDWPSLFPAERSYLERLFALIDSLTPARREQLFAPLTGVEAKMQLKEQNWKRGEFTLDHVDFLQRNPHLAEWRAAVASIFAQIDPVLDAQISMKGKPRLLVVVAPSELPVGPDRMWKRIEKFGQRVKVKSPDDVNEYLALLLTGQVASAKAPALSDAYAAQAGREPYSGWFVEAGEQLSGLQHERLAVGLSYEQLRAYRTRLMAAVQTMLEKEKLQGPRELSARLKTLTVQGSESGFSEDATLAEFVRATLLAGNGTLLINNTFVEWATVQAMRRARPAVMIAAFGIRNKMKPFSSLLIYADQEKVTPVPTQQDTLGTYVDLEIFYQYFWQETTKYAEYRSNTVAMYVLEGAEEMFVIAPPDFTLTREAPWELAEVHGQLRRWLQL